MCSNPAVSTKCEFRQAGNQDTEIFVAVDLFISETAAFADVILPASSYLEDEGTMTNAEARDIKRSEPMSRRSKA